MKNTYTFKAAGLILAAFLLLTNANASPVQNKSEADKQAQKGAEYLAKKDWRRAVESYEKALRADARHVEANYGLRGAHLNPTPPPPQLPPSPGRRAPGGGQLRPRRRLHEPQPAGRGARGLRRRRRGAAEPARARGARQHGRHPHRVPALQGGGGRSRTGVRARRHRRGGQLLPRQGVPPDRARPPGARPAPPEPQFAEDANLSVGLLLLKQNKAKEAVAPLEQAVRLNGQNAVAQALLGNALVAADRPEEGLAALRAAAAINPNEFFTQYGLGYAHLSLDQREEAVAAFTAALRIQPTSPEAFVGLGNAYTRMLRYREADVAFTRALALKSDSAEALMGQALLHYYQGQYPLLVETARRAAAGAA